MAFFMDTEIKSFWPEIQIESKIKNFFESFPDDDHDVEKEWSGKFVFSDLNWELYLSPRHSYFSFRVDCKIMPPECQIHCLFGIKNADGSIFKTYKNIKKAPFDLTPAYLFSFSKDEILTSKELLSKDGALLYFCNMRRMDVVNLRPRTLSSAHMREVSCQTSSLESIEVLSKDFEQLLATGHLADMKFRVGAKEFQAHKSVLAARSPVLESMFSHEMLENSSGVAHVEDCDENTFQNFLVFLYSGKLDNIPSANIAALYEIADKYDLQPLKEECAKRLAIDISVDLACDVLHVAALYDDKPLMETAVEYFMENAKEILATDQWRTFLKNHTDFGSQLILKFVNK